MYTFYWYPRCSTCKKAKAWLDAHEISYQAIDMVQDVPSAQTIAGWMAQSEYPMRRFFNTSGQKYRELGLKDQVGDFTLEEASATLATDGMLIKRPLLVKDEQVVAIGFKEADYEKSATI